MWWKWDHKNANNIPFGPNFVVVAAFSRWLYTNALALHNNHCVCTARARDVSGCWKREKRKIFALAFHAAHHNQPQHMPCSFIDPEMVYVCVRRLSTGVCVPAKKISIECALAEISTEFVEDEDDANVVDDDDVDGDSVGIFFSFASSCALCRGHRTCSTAALCTQMPNAQAHVWK